MKILNPWSPKKDYKSFFYESSPIYTNGEYSIFKQFDKCYLYTFQDIAINQLGGLNKLYLDAIAQRKRPENIQEGFLYDRAIQIIENKKILFS